MEGVAGLGDQALEQIGEARGAERADVAVGVVAGEAVVAGVEGRVAELCGVLNAVHGELVAVVGEVIESGAWRGYGIGSVAHWVTLHCGVSAATARRLVAVAEGLVERPATRDALAGGELSLDQVTPICREVPPAYEASAARVARHATVSQISTICSRYRYTDTDPAGGPGTEPAADGKANQVAECGTGERRRVNMHVGDDGAWHLHGVLPALEGAEIDKALGAARQHLHTDGETSPTWADALTEVARAYLGGRSVPMAARHQIVIHIDDTRLDDARIHLGQRLPSAVVDRLLCDTTVRALIDRDGRPVGPRPPTPPPLPATTAATTLGITGTYQHPSGEHLQHRWIHLQPNHRQPQPLDAQPNGGPDPPA